MAQEKLFTLNESAIYGNQPMIFKQNSQGAVTEKKADPKKSTELADSLSKGTTTPIKSKGTEKTPLGPLTIVDSYICGDGDTLTFLSKRDSIAYAKISEHYSDALIEAYIGHALSKVNADTKFGDMLSKAEAKEDAAAKTGDLKGIKAAKTEKDSINRAELAERGSIDQAEMTKTDSIRRAENAEKAEARKILEVTVRPRKHYSSSR